MSVKHTLGVFQKASILHWNFQRSRAWLLSCCIFARYKQFQDLLHTYRTPILRAPKENREKLIEKI